VLVLAAALTNSAAIDARNLVSILQEQVGVEEQIGHGCHGHGDRDDHQATLPDPAQVQRRLGRSSHDDHQGEHAQDGHGSGDLSQNRADRQCGDRECKTGEYQTGQQGGQQFTGLPARLPRYVDPHPSQGHEADDDAWQHASPPPRRLHNEGCHRRAEHERRRRHGCVDGEDLGPLPWLAGSGIHHGQGDDCHGDATDAVQNSTDDDPGHARCRSDDDGTADEQGDGDEQQTAWTPAISQGAGDQDDEQRCGRRHERQGIGGVGGEGELQLHPGHHVLKACQHDAG